MNQKTIIYIFIAIFGGIGSWLGSLLDNGNLFGIWGIIGVTVGGLLGIWAAVKLTSSNI
jgi:hypothetical protein